MFRNSCVAHSLPAIPLDVLYYDRNIIVSSNKII